MTNDEFKLPLRQLWKLCHWVLGFRRSYVIRHTLFVILTSVSVMAADWPTYMHDYSRSGYTPEQITPPVTEAWTWRSTHPPQPAWRGEAKWDGWNKVYDLKSRQYFDYAFHVVAVDGRVYFGSSADDKLYCLDAESGRELWTVFTEGPVRLAPTFHDGKLYVGSDDGFLYCLDAEDGSEEWKTRPSPRDYRIPGNGRVISAWPARTGVIVQNGLAYAGVGMFPSEGVYVCALDAATGDVRWKEVQSDLPAQGYLLASRSRLYVPTGRNNPVVLNILNGKRLRVVSGQGGTYALLTDDSLIFGPGKTGQLGVVEGETSDQLASFSGNHMIVAQGKSYLHSDTEIQALDRSRYMELARERKKASTEQSALSKRIQTLSKDRGKNREMLSVLRKDVVSLGQQIDRLTGEMQRCLLWKQSCEQPFCMILAGTTLYAGGENNFAAFNASDGSPLWQGGVTGKVYGLAASDGRIYASTDLGTIHCFAAAKQTARSDR